MKQFMKRAYFRLKYRNKNIRFAHGTVIGMNASFEGCNRIGKGTAFNGKLGYGSYLGGNSKINGRIGKFCCIASGVSVINGFHPTDAVSIHPAFFSTKRQCGMTYAAQNIYEETREAEPGYPIVIGNDVWIGQNALLFAGVHIGNGAVIAAGAVVTKNVPPYTVVGGVPAREIRRRFDDKTAERLEKIAWWDWPEELLRERSSDFADVNDFLANWE